MIKLVKRQSLKMSAAVVTGAMMSSSSAFASGIAANNGPTTFSNIAANLTGSIQNVPGLLSGLSYMFGILLGVLGVLKIKDHVENPGNTPLKEGAIRLAAGGALFALPIIYSAMQGSIGQNTGQTVQSATLNHVEFGVQ